MTINRQSREYVRWYQDALNRIDGAGLSVDGIAGARTRAAVRRYQTRKGLVVDGKVGSRTEAALVADGAPPPPGAPAAAFNLLVDANRDGTIDATPATSATWTFGAAGSGAVVLVNNDDDGIDGSPDNENTVVDGGNDASELAPLRIARAGTGTVPPGTTLELLVDRPDALRIFSSHAVSGTEIIGPAVGGSHRFASLPSATLNLAMEGVRYAGPGFDGEVQITLRATAPGGTRTEQTATVRVAPWIMPSHLEPVEKVFVVEDTFASNARFRSDLRRMVTAAGARLVEFRSSDVWMQDCMEFGFASIPGIALRSVLRAPRNRPLRSFPRALLGTDLGYTEQGTLTPFTTFDSSGNLEATPPFTSPAGKHFPFGRVYFGPGRGVFDTIDVDLAEFLRKQVVQEPVELDTAWLAVGHVDEVLSFVPAPGGLGFKMLIASPRRAYQILDALNATNPSDRLLHGRSFPLDLGSTPSFDVEQSIGTFLGLRSDFHPDLQAGIAGGSVIHTPQPLRDYNAARQADIDRIRSTMVSEIGLRDSDIIEVPAVLMPNPRTPQHADALIPGMVNMLVVNGHCIVPEPFGPRVGTPPVDRFEDEVRTQLAGLGLTVDFLDCWDEYHVALGEVHCGTNTLRRAVPAPWWEFQP